MDKIVQKPAGRVSRTLSCLRDISPAAVLIGTMWNVMDCVSLGLLVFPSAEDGTGSFSGLQIQAMSLYVMSTIISQLTMTLGGSLFPGALGSMLVEVLPFLRAIASAIQRRMGNAHPGVLPTTMAAYAMTSFLVGAIFLILTLLKCGRFTEYFPKTVLTGAIGAIGISLFTLGLELTLPASAEELSFSTAAHTLFSNTHLPLLAISIVAPSFLSISIRSNAITRIVRGGTHHPLYVPIFCLAVAAIFWIVVASAKLTDAQGLEALRAKGWLFGLEASERSSTLAWNYWALFDFRLVQWNAITAAINEIIVLIVIAVISLPIYIPAMAQTLERPSYNMNWEFFGHGISNLLAGAIGTVPNLVARLTGLNTPYICVLTSLQVITNSRFFTQAGGGRIEALFVTAFTALLFFFSSSILQVVPTVLAATLVLYPAIEFMIEALWDAPKTLLLSEWVVVLATMAACTALGFTPGIGVGIAAALFIHFCWNLIESRPDILSISDSDQSLNKDEWNASPYVLPPTAADAFRSMDVLERQSRKRVATKSTVIKYVAQCPQKKPRIVVIRPSTYISFIAIPMMETTMKTDRTIIIDFTSSNRAETCVGKFLKQKAQEIEHSATGKLFIFVGMRPESSLYADLKRGGIDCIWPDENPSPTVGKAQGQYDESRIPVLDTIGEALHWCDYSMTSTILESQNRASLGPNMVSDSSARNLDQDESALLRNLIPNSVANETLPYLPFQHLEPNDRMKKAGVMLRKRYFGDPVAWGRYSGKGKPSFLILKGRLRIHSINSMRRTSPSAFSHLPTRNAFKGLPGSLLRASKRFVRSITRSRPDEKAHQSDVKRSLYLYSGDLYGIGCNPIIDDSFAYASVSSESCWILEVDPSNLHGLAWVVKLSAALQQQKQALALDGAHRIEK